MNSMLMIFFESLGITFESEGIQCYACGLKKVNPELDLKGSYPRIKTYNHSCDEMLESQFSGRISHKYIRNCPPNVGGCFVATGYYDRGDGNPHNDISKSANKI